MAQNRATAADREIERNLKRAFDEVVQEPVPERFLSLLDRLRAQDAENDTERDKPEDD